MKILILMILTLPVRADILLDIINGKYEEPSDISYKDYESEYLGEDHGLDNGEHYSWDNLYLCSLCGIEVIVDPYADMGLEESDY